jgi:hypothetical protein
VYIILVDLKLHHLRHPPSINGVVVLTLELVPHSETTVSHTKHLDLSNVLSIEDPKDVSDNVDDPEAHHQEVKVHNDDHAPAVAKVCRLYFNPEEAEHVEGASLDDHLFQEVKPVEVPGLHWLEAHEEDVNQV